MAVETERREEVVEPGEVYGPGLPVRVHVVRRGRRVDIHDGGEAVRLAGRPAKWLERAQEVAAAEALNVNRRGVVFVPTYEGRDTEALTARLAATSGRLYAELLELDSE